MIRLVPNQSEFIERTAKIEFTFDGRRIIAHEGETILVALMRSGIKHLRDAPADGTSHGTSRGAFCCMGLCQECMVKIDGKRIESCRQIASHKLIVESLKQLKSE